MGLSTAPNSFQLLMDKVLRGLTFKSVLCYLDDILICSSTFDQHLADIQEVFSRLRNAGLKLGPKKCVFAKDECVFLGHEISKEGIKPPSDRIDAIKYYPIPRNQNELRRTVGLFNWFRKFIPSFSTIAYPLNALLKKGVKFRWTKEHQSAFDTLKSLLVNSKALSFPRYDLEFRLAVDTSSKGVGYMLYQIHEDGNHRVVRFGSKGLNRYQQSYGPTKLELLGMVFSVLDCAPYLRGHHFVAECDHQALQPLFQKQLRGAIYERWIAILQQFDISIEWKPGKQMIVPDALSRCHPNPALSVMDSSPAEEDPHFPYVANMHSKGIKLPSGDTLEDIWKLNDSDHNVAINNVCVPSDVAHDCHTEYDADTEDANCDISCLISIRKRKRTNKRLEPRCKSLLLQHVSVNRNKASDHEEQSACALSDSVHLSDNLYKTTELDSADDHILDDSITCVTDAGHLQQAYQQTTDIDSDKVPETINQVPVSSSQDQSSVESEVLPFTSKGDDSASELDKCDIFRVTDFSVEHIKTLQGKDSNCKPMIDYLDKGCLPLSQKAARKLILESSDFVLIDNLLFHSRVSKSKRSNNMNHYQLVLPEPLIPTILHLYHDSTISGHCGIQETIDRIREHYYFRRYSIIVSDYVRSCTKCQQRKVPPMKTNHAITAFKVPTRPFQVWELDLYGPLPMTPSGKRYIFTAVDMFTKYLFAVPIADNDALSVGVVIFQLVCTFGVCDTILSDQGSEFIARATKETCKLLHIQQEFTPSYSHHCLGACERTHRVLATKLTPYMTVDKNNWEDILPAMIFSMNASVNSSSGYSPFEAVFGGRPTFPLSQITPNIDNLPTDIHNYVDRVRQKIDIIHRDMREHIANSQSNMLDNANMKVRSLSFSSGDYVFLRTEPTGTGQKLQNIYKGVFVIQEMVSPHLALLRDNSSGKVFDKPVHVNRLKPAYVRAPTPTNYFCVTRTTKVDICVQTDPIATESIDTKLQQDSTAHSDVLRVDSEPSRETLDRTSKTKEPAPRPRRVVNKPRRYCSVDNVYPDDISSSDINDKQYNVKRVLARRQIDSEMEYLVHWVGEPSQNASWVKFSDLNESAKLSVIVKPPKLIT